jgi:hypothetical protein
MSSGIKTAGLLATVMAFNSSVTDPGYSPPPSDETADHRKLRLERMKKRHQRRKAQRRNRRG